MMKVTKILMPKKLLFITTGIILFITLLLLPPPAELSLAGWRTAAVASLMVFWWISEPIPLYATALLPLLLFPILGTSTIYHTAAPYAHPVIFLFLGGFILALAIQKCGLHRRIAIHLITHTGKQPQLVILGVMLACALLSMWISNTATAIMMLPIAASLSTAMTRSNTDTANKRHFATALMLSVAYGCTIGGLGTLIGTPPNAFMAGFLDQHLNIAISFVHWMLFAVPLVIIAIPLAFLLLTKIVFPINSKQLKQAYDHQFFITTKQSLGKMTSAEKRVTAVFILTALLWVFRPLINKLIPNLSDAGIAMFAAIILFIIPAKTTPIKFLMNWQTVRKLPWGILILFGGGLSLASMVTSSGLAIWIGDALHIMVHWPTLAIIASVTLLIMFLTELTSNSATVATFLPIVAAFAHQHNLNPLTLVIPATLAASCAFMLPVATPPNAVVYSSGAITLKQMVRAGLLFNLLFLILIIIFSHFLMPVVFHD